MSAAAEMVDCPACVRGEGCEDCDWTGRMTADRSAEWVRNNRETAEAGADDRAHAWRERMQEGG
jgi:hypothetical protein